MGSGTCYAAAQTAQYTAQQYAAHIPTDAEAKSAAASLARLIERQLGYCEGHIDSVALRLFIRAYWSRVSTFAHTIHDHQE